MAKKNGRDDPPKPQVTENEQMSDIILILDKMELILQAVSQIDKDGRYKTVPADKEHTNSFLKIDRYASMFENFLKNFWSQLKDPTRFGILSVKEKALGRPESEAGHRRPRRRKKDRRGGRIPQTVRDCPPRQGKPKYQPSKSRRNGKRK
ncbi:hypothetical protein NXX40_04030 [Parabacteroides distasonis]|nr:hypothetical protein [Parabacteroides distasonis]